MSVHEFHPLKTSAYRFVERLFHVGVIRCFFVAFAQNLVDIQSQKFRRSRSRSGDSVVVAVLLACLRRNES